MNRRELREHIFKLLFVSEFNSSEEMPEQLKLYFETMEDLSEKDERKMSERYALISEHITEIDDLLNHTSKGWKTTRMSKVDLAVLRLAVGEILYDEKVPVGVAINEAVELAKRFGGETSGSFINGILGRIASEHSRKEEEKEKNPEKETIVSETADEK